MQLDIYQSALIGVLALLLGLFLNKKVAFLKRICIPAPVSGGIIFSMFFLLLNLCLGVEVSFDGTIKDIAMMIFFTSVGFQADISTIRKGGKAMGVMLGLVIVLIILQNCTGLGLAALMSLDPLIGMSAGSIPMSGGHGTAGGFAPLLQSMGLDSAASLTMAAATFGLVAGSLTGGPLAERLISKFKLSPEDTTPKEFLEPLEGQEAGVQFNAFPPKTGEETFMAYSIAVYWIFIAIGLGTLMSKLLALTGITFPTYFGSLLVAAIIRNVTEAIPGIKRKIEIREIVSVGNISLSLFLGIAMVSLKLWELAGVAAALLVILLAQLLLIVVFARYVAFPLLGKDYDAAVLVSGLCGFGLGATPNAMANMSAVCNKYHYSPLPFIIIPVIGSMFVDIINVSIITLFLNLLH